MLSCNVFKFAHVFVQIVKLICPLNPYLSCSPGDGKLHYIRSRWGGKLLVIDSFLFSSNKRQSNGRTYWRCTFCSARKKDPCKVRCCTKDGQVIKFPSIHNHAPQLMGKLKAS